MPVKVIEKGFNNKKNCSGCGSKLEFELEDVHHKHVPPRDAEDEEDKFTITCPSCKQEVNVDQEVTGAARNRVRELQKLREANDMDL